MTGVPLNIDWQQILLHLFNFTILFGALYILLYKPVKDFMAKREEHFADMESKTTQALADAESSKASYEEKEKAFDDEVRAEKTRLSKEIEAERVSYMTFAMKIQEERDEATKETLDNVILKMLRKHQPISMIRDVTDCLDEYIEAVAKKHGLTVA